MIVRRRKLLLVFLFMIVLLLFLEMHRIVSRTENKSSDILERIMIQTTTQTSTSFPRIGILTQIEELTEQCMNVSYLDVVLNSPSIISQAKNNANYFFNEFRKVIPELSLHKYKSHCWEEIFWTQWSKDQYRGHVANLSFSKKMSSRIQILSSLTSKFPSKEYRSNLICLPNMFLLGFPKCGSTFLYCVITKLISVTLFNSTVHNLNAEKEPHFWVLANAAKAKHVPRVNGIGNYLMNFLSGLSQISKGHDGILVDGTPNLIFNWPRFRETEHDLVNYCLLPSVLPKLLPNSRFIVIMRNPLKMLYSAFWFSCTMLGIKIPKEKLLKGPDLFHTRISTKIYEFNRCMTDISSPSICELNNSYSACIKKRLHLLDKCVHKITYNLFSPDLPKCGRSRVAMGIYYAHIHKWLSIVPKHRFLFLTLEELTSNFDHTVGNILEFLNLKRGTAPKYNVLKQVLNSCGKNSQSSVDYKNDHRLQMRSDTKVMLQEFYHPFNSLLAHMLGSEQFLWL